MLGGTSFRSPGIGIGSGTNPQTRVTGLVPESSQLWPRAGASPPPGLLLPHTPPSPFPFPPPPSPTPQTPRAPIVLHLFLLPGAALGHRSAVSNHSAYKMGAPSPGEDPRAGLGCGLGTHVHTHTSLGLLIPGQTSRAARPPWALSPSPYSPSPGLKLRVSLSSPFSFTLHF